MNPPPDTPAPFSGFVHWREGCREYGPDLDGVRAYARGDLRLPEQLAPHYARATVVTQRVRRVMMDCQAHGGPRVTHDLQALHVAVEQAESLASSDPAKASFVAAANQLRILACRQLSPRWGSGPACWPDWQNAGRINIRSAPDGIDLVNLSRSLRHLIVPVNPDNVFITADLTAAHAHITAAIPGDPQLVQDLAADPDRPYNRIGELLGVPQVLRRAAGKAVMNPCLNGCRSTRVLLDALAAKGIRTGVNPLAAFEQCYPGVARWHARLEQLDPHVGFASPLGLVFRPPARGAMRRDGTLRSYLGARTAILLQHTETVGMLGALETLVLNQGEWDATNRRWRTDLSAPLPVLNRLGASVRVWLYDGLLVEAPAEHAAEVENAVAWCMLKGMSWAMAHAAVMYGGRQLAVQPVVSARVGERGMSWGEVEALAARRYR